MWKVDTGAEYRRWGQAAVDPTGGGGFHNAAICRKDITAQGVPYPPRRQLSTLTYLYVANQCSGQPSLDIAP